MADSICANPFIFNEGLTEENSFTHLIKSISPDTENEIELIEHSNYYTDDEFVNNIQITESKIKMLSLNCQSINAKFAKLKTFLAAINEYTDISIICLQETWGHEDVDMSFYNLPNYSMVYENRRLSAHGGLLIYIRNDFSYTKLNLDNRITETSNVFESLVIEVWRKSCKYNKFVIGSIYRIPSYSTTDLNTFTEEFITLLNALRNKSKFVYLCGDYNIDLLKIHRNNPTNHFYESSIACGFVPKITLPTRICDTTSTLIDNVYTNVIDKPHISGILISPISDHQRYFCALNDNTVKNYDKTKCITTENFSENNMKKFRNEIANAEIYSKLDPSLNADPNSNYEILSKILCDAKNNHIPRRSKKLNKRKDKIEAWITDEILATVVQKNKMYVKWKSTPITHVDYLAIKQNFKTYDKIVRRSIEVEKKRYFERRFETYKNNMKKTWITIGESLNRHKKKSDLPLSFIHNNRELTIPTDIANAFNSHFAAIGRNIAAALDSDHIKDQTYSTYLNTPHRSEWRFKCVSEFEIIIAINNLENKSSAGCDGISNKLLKYIKGVVTKPLTLIINQMIVTGIYPKAFKASKVSPILKKGDNTLLSNYRPISLLPTISKIFERIIYN